MGNRVIVPPQGRAQAIAVLHEAHPDISRMKALARGYVWWPNMDRELEDAVSSANYTRRPQQKHLSTHGSGLVNLGQECILIMQGLTKYLQCI